MTHRAGLVATLTLVAVQSIAAPISFQEEGNYDLSEIRDAGNSFSFDVGVNTVSGHEHYIDTYYSNGEWSLDADAIFFDIPEFAALDDIRLLFSVDYTDNFYDGLSHYWLYDCSNPLTNGCEGNFSLNPALPWLYRSTIDLAQGANTNVFTPFASLSSGRYALVHGLELSWAGVEDFEFNRDYQLSFSLAAVEPTSVPEPASLALIVLSLLGVQFARRRSRTRAFN